MPCINLIARNTELVNFHISDNTFVISNHNSNSDELNQREDAMAYRTTECMNGPDFMCT